MSEASQPEHSRGLERPQGLEVDYNGSLARSYQAGREIHPEARATWRAAVAGHLAGARVVADVGAGTGRFARALAVDFEAQTYAVEPADGMRANGRAIGEHPNLLWVGAQAEALPLKTQSIDVIWSAFTTHYLDLAGAASQFARVLAPGGRLLIWHAFEEVFDGLEWFRWFPSARAIDEQRMPTRDVVCQAFESAGFSLTEHSVHHMLITENLTALAERLSHRSISTLRLISDAEFDDGLARLRQHAAEVPVAPVFAPNVLLAFTLPD